MVAFALLALIGDIGSKADAVMPTPTEMRWMKVGWLTDMDAARREAQASGKPMFLWIMNGHPMGCT